MPRPPAPCGTYSAYRRHLRDGEDVDAECRAAQVSYAAEQKKARHAGSHLGPVAGQDLGPRGVAYRDSILGTSTKVPAAKEHLVIEGARMADRLEQMNDIISGKGVIKLLHFRMKEPMDADGLVTVEMSIDGVMAEVRQLQAAFERLTKTLLTQFDVGAAEKGADPFDAFFGGTNVVGITTAPS